MYQSKIERQSIPGTARFGLQGQPCKPRMGFRGPQVLAYIQQAIATDGIAPTYEHMADALGFLSAADVCKVVMRLERYGLVIRPANTRKRITLP